MSLSISIILHSQNKPDALLTLSFFVEDIIYQLFFTNYNAQTTPICISKAYKSMLSNVTQLKSLKSEEKIFQDPLKVSLVTDA